jgi:hypothetical protein
MLLCDADGGTEGSPIAPMDEVSQTIPHGIVGLENV